MSNIDWYSLGITITGIAAMFAALVSFSLLCPFWVEDGDMRRKFIVVGTITAYICGTLIAVCINLAMERKREQK